MSDTVMCKYCFLREVVKWGSSRGKKLYSCSPCGHSFSEAGSFLGMLISHQVIITALEIYFEDLSVSNAQNTSYGQPINVERLEKVV